MIAEVSAKPNSKRFLLAAKKGRLTAFLKSPPEKNKANSELVRGLSRALGCEVRLVAGKQSKRKLLEMAISEKEWKAFVGSLEE